METALDLSDDDCRIGATNHPVKGREYVRLSVGYGSENDAENIRIARKILNYLSERYELGSANITFGNNDVYGAVIYFGGAVHADNVYDPVSDTDEINNANAELERRGIGDPTARQLRDVIIDIRRAKLPDPQEMGNAGSFFMNPMVARDVYEELQAQYPAMPHYYIDEQHEKIPAGWLIEQCGWKGRSMGRAGVHDKQALVLVNRGGATGAEIVALCEAIRHDVKQKFGIDIQPEVNIV